MLPGALRQKDALCEAVLAGRWILVVLQLRIKDTFPLALNRFEVHVFASFAVALISLAQASSPKWGAWWLGVCTSLFWLPIFPLDLWMVLKSHMCAKNAQPQLWAV